MRNVKAVSPYDVYYAVHKGVAHYSFKNPEQKPEIVTINSNIQSSMTVFDVFDNYLVFGD